MFANFFFIFSEILAQWSMALSYGVVMNCGCMFCLCVQENLLQSVLPVYISMKMKLAILERLQDCKDKEDQQLLVKDNNFHSLYVKRHENVRYYHQRLYEYTIDNCMYCI